MSCLFFLMVSWKHRPLVFLMTQRIYHVAIQKVANWQRYARSSSSPSICYCVENMPCWWGYWYVRASLCPTGHRVGPRHCLLQLQPACWIFDHAEFCDGVTIGQFGKGNILLQLSDCSSWWIPIRRVTSWLERWNWRGMRIARCSCSRQYVGVRTGNWLKVGE
jgi:hypothetical protein